MKLKYDLSVTGVQNVERALGSVERRYNESNRRMARKAAMSNDQKRAFIAQAGLGSRQVRFQHQMAMKNIAEQNKAKVAGERAAAKEAANAQRQRVRNERLAQQENLRQTRLAHRQSMDLYRSRASFTRGAIGTVTGSVRGSMGTIAGGATMALGLGGGMVVADSVRKAADTEKAAAVLANLAVGSEGEKRSRSEIKASVIAQANAEAVRTGLGTEGIVTALREHQAKSGMVAEAQKILPFMADMADAYGADIGDVGRTAGQIAMTLATTRGIRGEENAQITKEIMSAMAGQAKIGTIEFADLATLMGSLMSSTARFEGNIADLVNTMGAFGQMSLAGGADSPAEAMTSIKRLSDDMRKYGNTAFKDNEIDVFTDESRTRLRDPAEVLFEVIDKTKGDMVKSEKMFKLRADKAFAPFQQAYVQAGGGDAGMKAMRDLLEMFKGAKVTEKDVTDSARNVRETSAKKFEIAMADLQVRLGNKMLPALTRLIPTFERMVPSLEKGAIYLARFIEALANNPIGTIGKIIAAKIVLDIAAAGIGNAIKTSLVRLVAGKAPVLPAAGATTAAVTGGATTAVAAAGGGGVKGAAKRFVGMPTASAMGSAAGSGLGLGLAVGTAIFTAGVVNIEASEANMDSVGAKLKEARLAAQQGDVATTNRLFREAQDEMMRTGKPGIFESLTGSTVLDPNVETERATVSKFVEEMRAQISVAQENQARMQAEAAAAQKTAAEDQSAAAKATVDALSKINGPNRGNSPSPATG